VYFSRCVLVLSLNTGGKADVTASSVGITGRSIGARAEQPGGLRISRADAAKPGCPRNIQLSDQTAVAITARVRDGSADACAIADLGTEYAVRVLTERGLPHLSSLGGDANSLQRQDACALLDDQTLRRVPTLDPTRRREGFGNWSCQWGNNPYTAGFQPPVVDLNFQWVKPLIVREGERRIRLGGRDVYIGPGKAFNGQTACHAWVVHRDRPLSTGERAQEIVVLAVQAALPATEQCQVAQDFAAVVIPKLPPP